MALEWQAPFQINPNAETPSQRSLANLNQTLSNVGQNWQQRAYQQALLKLQQSQNQREAQKFKYEYGDPSATSSWTGSPLDIGRQPWAQSPSSGGDVQGPSPSSSLSSGSMGPQPMSMAPPPGNNQPMSYANGMPTSFQMPGITQQPQQSPMQMPQMPSMGGGGYQPPSPPQSGGMGMPPSGGMQPPQGSSQPTPTDRFMAWKAQQNQGLSTAPGGMPDFSGQASTMMNRYMQSLNDPSVGMVQRKSYLESAKDLGTIAKDFSAAGTEKPWQSPEQAAYTLYPNDASKRAAAQTNYERLYPGGKVPNSAITMSATGNRFSVTQGEKESQFGDKRLTALGDALDPSKQRSGAFGISKQVFDRAERLESLASAFPDGNLRKQEIEELAIGLNSMLSGANTGAQEQVRSLMPNTIVGNVQKTVEWLTNHPQGAQQQEIVKRMLGSMTREKATASDQMKRTQFQRIGRYADLEQSNPDGFLNTLQSAGVDPDEYRAWKKGGYKPISAVQKPEAAPSPGQGGGAQTFQVIKQNPKTGQKVGWNGSQWVPVQ